VHRARPPDLALTPLRQRRRDPQDDSPHPTHDELESTMSTIERDAVSGVTIAGVSAANLSAPSLQDDPKPIAFYIQSEVHNSDWVLARNAQGKVRLAHKDGSIGQLWMREDDPRGGFFLVNAETNEVLHQTRPQGGEVALKAKSLGDSSMLWRQEAYRGVWSGLNAFSDWEQKLNLAGNGPYNENSVPILWEYSNKSPNECWQLIPDTGLITLESITYDMSQAQVSRVEPFLCKGTSIDNRLRTVPVTTAVELARSVNVTRQFSYSESVAKSLKIAEKLGVKINIKDIVEVSPEVSSEQSTTTTTTYLEQTAQGTTTSDKVTVSVQVPAGAHYQFMVRVAYGKVSVPFTAKVSRVLPTGATQIDTVHGVYTNVNSINYDIVAVDVTSGTPRTVQTLPSPAGAPLPRP
jgi:hypothetical protein